MMSLLAVTMPATGLVASEALAPAMPNEQAAVPDGSIAFDIPAQSLTSALDAYGVAAHREVLYNADLAVGRQSAPVKGYFTPESALQMLLEGTGLLPRYMAANAFVLVADDQPSAPLNTASAEMVKRYYGRIQAGFKQAFCANPLVQPGDYRVAVGFRIGSNGAVERTELLGSTGDRDRDASIVKTIGGLAFGAPPPGFAQPVILVVTPQSQAAAQACGATGVRSIGAAP